MKQRRLSTQLTSASLALLLLLTAIAGKSLLLPKAVAKKPVSEQTSKNKKANEERPVIQEMSLVAVVAPAVSFDFEQSFYFLPTIFSIELIGGTNALPKRFDVFYYFFSFFRNVFGHFIAINAP
ncbi:hypothetical protein [Runella sp.]|uniref:hypothetical protein n=1 Tax=Runella sp. TaxID=1960881 RepID=UPI003D0F22A8